jgi:hypothetical protein
MPTSVTRKSNKILPNFLEKSGHTDANLCPWGRIHKTSYNNNTVSDIFSLLLPVI